MQLFHLTQDTRLGPVIYGVLDEHRNLSESLIHGAIHLPVDGFEWLLYSCPVIRII